MEPISLRTPLALLLISLSAIAAVWWWLATPITLARAPIDPGAKLMCVSYAPFRDGQTPLLLTTHIAPEQIAQDLAQLAKISDCVRTYSIENGLDQVPALAAKVGLKVIQGIWLSSDRLKNQAQISTAVALTKQYPGVISALVVGNEVLLRGELAAEDIAGILREVKAAAPVPVTYADVWEFWLRNRDLAAAVAANDRATIAHARLDIQNSLSTALGNARLAMLAQSTSAAPSTFSSELQTAAKGAAAAIAADPNYCTSVTHPGNPVNAAVHRFKLAWNASQTPKVPIGTGTYEVATTVALAQVNGSAPSACGANQRPVPAPKPPPPLPQSKRDEDLDAPNLSSGWSVGKVIFGVAIAGAAAGGVAFLVTRPSKPSRGQPVTRREGFAT